MEIVTKVSDDAIEAFIRNIMESYPEASFCLQCIPHRDGSWGYEKCEYRFIDEDEDLVSGEDALEGFLCKAEAEDFSRPGFLTGESVVLTVYTVTLEDLKRGFKRLIEIALGMVPGKRFHSSGWDPRDFFKEDWEEWAGQWDATVLDGMVQCAIYGDVILG